VSVTPTNAWRNEAIEALGDLRDAYDAAHERAVEEWNHRYSSSGLYESTGGLWTVNERGEFVRK
jgi:hypothetical protein